jgi:anaerobic selenocysteine-containing dehydrogenase
MKFNRRDFLKMGGGAGITIALGGGLWNWTQSPSPLKTNPPGVERWVPTVCGQCMGGCGILVRVIDGWAVNITGNPLHPVNRGSICPKGIAGLQGLYDPDRIRSPLKRVGNRGEGKWKPITWDEGIHIVTESLKNLRRNGESHHLIVLGGRYRGLMRVIWERFLEAFGSPNYIDNQFQWEGLPLEGLFLAQGIFSPFAYDIENAQYILSLGSNFLETFWSPAQAIRAYGHFRRGRPGIRGKLIQIESRLSATGIKADEWIPIKPGTESLLALGIAHMIIKEGLYNKDFVSHHCFGFEGWKEANGKSHIGFKDFVLSEFEPNIVSKKSGIPVDTIIRLARDFASNQPSLAIGYRDRAFHQMAIYILNGLVGNIDIPGGILIPREIPFSQLEGFKKDSISEKGLLQPRIDESEARSFSKHRPYNFAKNILSGKPYKPKILFLYYTNPLFSNPDSNLFLKAFQEIPFIVSFSPYMDDSTQFADLILPDHTPLERWQDDPLFLNNGVPVLGIRQPVVKPLYQTKSTGDLIIHLAKSLGNEIGRAFPWGNFHEMMNYSLKGIFDAKRGDVFGLQFDEAWIRLLQKGGWWSPSYKTYEDFLNLLSEKGGWWDPVYEFGQWDRIFKTPSKKFEFYAQGLKRIKTKELDDSSFLPHWEEIEKVVDPELYPFHLNIFKTIVISGTRNSNQPWLQDIVGYHLFERWNTWVEVNPETASRLGISDGDWVWVESPKAKIKAKVRLYQGTMPDVVNIPFGLGHISGGRWTKNIGSNPYQLISEDIDPLTDYPLSYTTMVRIYKA